MKAISCRRALPDYHGDQADLLFLIKKMEITTTDEIQNQIDRFFPDQIILNENREVLETLIKEATHG